MASTYHKGGGGGKTAIEQANEAAFKREEEIRGLFDKIIGTYAPGGSFGAGTEAMLQRQKQKFVGSGTQQLISSGLYGSTVTAGLGKRFEEEVGMPTRLKLEDIRTQAYTGALGQKASFIESIQDVAPSFETLATLQSQAAARPQRSLSDYLAENFGSVPNPTSTTGAYQASQRQAMSEDDRKRVAKLEALRQKYGTVGVV